MFLSVTITLKAIVIQLATFQYFGNFLGIICDWVPLWLNQCLGSSQRFNLWFWNLWIYATLWLRKALLLLLASAQLCLDMRYSNKFLQEKVFKQFNPSSLHCLLKFLKKFRQFRCTGFPRNSKLVHLGGKNLANCRI